MPSWKQHRGRKGQKRALIGSRSKKGLYMMIPLLAFVLLFLGGCGVTPRQKPGLVTPEEIAAEIIPKEGAPRVTAFPWLSATHNGSLTITTQAR